MPSTINCTESPELFFSRDSLEVAQAMSLCQTCPLFTSGECAEMSEESEHGVWAGMPKGEQRSVYINRIIPSVKTKGPPPTLDPEQVAELTRQGLTARQIAERFGVTKRTVERTRSAARAAA